MQVDPAEKRMKEVKEAFDAFDKDNNGSVSVNQLGNIFKYLQQDIPDELLEQYIQELDPEQTGTIDFLGLMQLLTKNLKDDDTLDELMACFKVFDLESTGTISAAEMRYILIEMGEKMNPADVKDILKEMDPNDSGMCSYVEYVNKKYQDLQVIKAKAAKAKGKKKKK